MKLAPFFFLLLNLLLSSLAMGQIQQNIVVEQTLEKRVRDMVSSLDPSAQVFVKMRASNKSVRLPASAQNSLLNLSLVKPPSSLEAPDFTSIKIRIMTSLTQFPTWLERQIKESVDFGVPVELEVVQFDAESKEIIEDQRSLDPSLKAAATGLNGVLSLISENTKYFMATVGGAFVAFLILLTFVQLRLHRILKSEFKGLATAFSESSGGGGGQIIDINPSSYQNKLPQGLPQSVQLESTQNYLMSQTLTSLVGIFSDCYWCEEDAYAAWIWDKMSLDQRKEVLKLWPPAESYSRYLTGIDPENLNYHNHPIYFNPPPLEFVSQKDLAPYLETNPKVWHGLSPIRQKTVYLPIEQKVACVASAAQGDIPLHEWPQDKSALRVFQTSSNFGNLTVADEKLLVENPDLIPKEMRAEVPTLLWFSMLDPSKQAHILHSFSAQEIAEAWIGPHPIMSKIRANIPEKKMNLVESYRVKIKPSRESRAFQKIMESVFPELKAKGKKAS